MTYELLCGSPPFDSDSGDIQELYRNIQTQQLDFSQPEFDKISNEAK